MCLHLVSNGRTQCKKNPELDLCGTHTVNLKWERPSVNGVQYFTDHVNEELLWSALDSTRKNWIRVVGLGEVIAEGDPALPGYIYNGSDYIGELVYVARTKRHFVMTKHAEFILAGHFISGTVVDEPTTHPRGVVCGNRAAHSGQPGRHLTAAEVRHCYGR